MGERVRCRCGEPVEMPHSIDRFTVVLTDVDAYERALGHVGEERRMAPSVRATKVFESDEIQQMDSLLHAKTREDHRFQLIARVDRRALLPFGFLLSGIDCSILR